jgi:hypothetical protein
MRATVLLRKIMGMHPHIPLFSVDVSSAEQVGIRRLTHKETLAMTGNGT